MKSHQIRLALVGPPDSREADRRAAEPLPPGRVTIVSATETLEAALKAHRPDFDAVIIRTPLESRGSEARLAAEAGKHVLVNAPVAPSLREAEEIINACTQTEVCWAVGGTLRFLPSNQAIAASLSEGKLGTPGLLRIHRWRSQSDEPRGDLIEQVFSDIDLATWLLGTAPSEVYAVARAKPAPSEKGPRMPDYLQIHFAFLGGGMAVLDFTVTLPAGRGYDALSLIGSSGAAYADDHHNTHLLFRGENPQALVSSEGHHNTTRELLDFVGAITERRQPLAGREDARAAHRIAEAVVQSLDSGQVLHQRGGCYEPDQEC